MKKKEKIEEPVIKKQKFVIPQIDFSSKNFIRKRVGFKKSIVCSPFHGTNVLDKTTYVDNSGTVDVDYGYDFIREDKHLSDEELERRHGTKYYEFTFHKSDSDLYQGSHYENQESETVKKEYKPPFSIVGSADDLLNDNKPQQPVVEESIDYNDENTEFKINIEIDETVPSYEYSTYENVELNPGNSEIPSINIPDLNTVVEEEFEIEDDTVDVTPVEKPSPVYNPPVDKNISIEEAIRQMQEAQQNEKPAPTPVKVVEPVVEPTVVEDDVYNCNEHLYENYYIPFKELFPQSQAHMDENPEWVEKKKEIINQSLKSFSIDGEVVLYTKGPAFTRYEICLAAGVNVKKVSQISDNLQKDLQATAIRIQAPIPGKNTIGIEVPNDIVETVHFGDIISDDFVYDNKPLNVALGKYIDGSPVHQNIVDMPHALIAGATQSGKSVSLNTILVSLLVKNKPSDLKIILVDPKKVEFTFYEDLPHLATPVINDPVLATEALKWAVREMERRYEVLRRAKVKKISDYNKKRETNPNMEKMPFIVIVVDEFNDLVMNCGAEANEAIIRLAQMARACGMHIILATQRPTVDVVNGTIKANITCRFAFKVASDIDSRTILDEVGAESLLGRGDMICKNNFGQFRAQGAFISDDEIGNICEYICNRYSPDYLFTHEDLKNQMNKNNQSGGAVGGTKEAPGESDEYLYQIAKACVSSNTCSINSIQSGFGLGFNRAQRIVQLLEDRGIVTPKNGTKGREILVTEEQLKQIFNINEE